MSPETAVKPPWRNIFQTPHFKKVLALVAVDEAHCIATSQTSHIKFSKLPLQQ
jgi:superfamily II DNA helicase RecQ